MRQRFRDKDFGNSGNLTMQQMKDVLKEMRADGHGPKAKNFTATIQQRMEEMGATGKRK